MNSTDNLPGLDVVAINAWLRYNGATMPSMVKAWAISGGRSNLTYGMADDSGDLYCLRRPPLSHGTGSAHDVLREYGILQALHCTDVPVPEVLVACKDDHVIGAPFFVMRFVGGIVCGDAQSARALSRVARAKAGPSMMSALALIHHVDLQGAGLATLSKFEDYIGRQLRRFRRQLNDDDVARHPLLEGVAALLEHARPDEQACTLVHGDFKLGNCIVNDSGDVVAVLDWELATLGDPLADIGWLLASWSEPGDTAIRIVAPPTRAGGFASKADMVAAYEKQSDLDLSSLSYYVALAEWKWACIDVGIRKRFSAGAMGDASSVDLDIVELEIQSRLHHAALLLGST